MDKIGIKLKELIELRIIRSSGEVETYVFEGSSPTSTLINDIYSELFASTPSAVVGALSSYEIYDATNVFICSNTLSSTDFTVDTVNSKISFSKTCTAQNPGTVATANIYAGTKQYFSTPVPSTSVNAGDTVVLNWSLTVSTSHSTSTTGLSVSSVDSSGLRTLLLQILAGQRPTNATLTLITAKWMAGTTTLLSASLSRDATNHVVSHGSLNFTASGNLDSVIIDANNYSGVIKYSLVAVSVVTTDYAQYSATITVS
ncbi:MAG: hypothetical protein C0179_05465 [Fervidicoccus sp.]|nr:MAG: hypothetical protein C0179_05465 [Fervidicoccus sp.]